jgi:chemotaxis signal transduction protein
MESSEILLEAGTNELELIEFFIDEGPELGQSRFGVNVAKVLEVIESPGLVPLPGAPHPCFMGTIPLRDMVLPVLDLAVWLGLSRRRLPNEIILVMGFLGRITGFLASGVSNIHRVRWADVAPPHPALTSQGGGCITGLTRIDGRFIQLLDLEKVLLDLDLGMSDTPEPTGTSIRRRALVADDSAVMRHRLRELLSRANFEVILAKDGQEALDLLRRPDAPRPDIVITDVEMPRLDGYTLTKRIKEENRLTGMPVVLFSSLFPQELRHKGDTVGADGQISKPEFSRLAELAISLIEKSRQKGETDAA